MIASLWRWILKALRFRKPPPDPGPAGPFIHAAAQLTDRMGLLLHGGPNPAAGISYGCIVWSRQRAKRPPRSFSIWINAPLSWWERKYINRRAYERQYNRRNPACRKHATDMSQ